MKLIKNITPKNLSPRRIFRSRKDRSSLSKSDPPSFGSATSLSSDSSSTNLKSGKGEGAGGTGTPTSVLPETSGDWSLSEITTNVNFELMQAIKVIIDRDNDGKVSRKELEALLSRLGGQPPSDEEVAMMLSEVEGREDSGCISVEALMSRFESAACEPACHSELRETFDCFDTDHDGKITAEELLNFFTTIGDEQCTLDDCRRMIAGVDKNGDGFVCFEDFSRMMELQRL